MDVKKIAAYMLTLAFAASIISSHARSTQRPPRLRRQRSSAARSAEQIIPSVNIPATALAGKQFTVQNLASLINTFNPANTSDFLILTTDGRSMSASLAGYNWRPFQNEVVTLQTDPNRISILTKNGCFTDTQTQQNYQNSLVWFKLPQVPNVAFYLIDPNPGRSISAGGIIRSPAVDIINQWANILQQRGLIQRFQ